MTWTPRTTNHATTLHYRIFIKTIYNTNFFMKIYTLVGNSFSLALPQRTQFHRLSTFPSYFRPRPPEGTWNSYHCTISALQKELCSSSATAGRYLERPVTLTVCCYRVVTLKVLDTFLGLVVATKGIV